MSCQPAESIASRTREIRVLRVADPNEALSGLARLFDVTAAALRVVLPSAVAEVNDVPTDRDRALCRVLERRLGPLGTPDRVHYFHGTRVTRPWAFCERGLLPLDAVLDALWDELGALLGETVQDVAWRALRRDMEHGLVGPRTYPRRGSVGPMALLVREVLLEPERYSSVNYLQAPEVIDDICQAACERFGVDLAGIYAQASIPCIVEFRAVPADVLEAVSSAAR